MTTGKVTGSLNEAIFLYLCKFSAHAFLSKSNPNCFCLGFLNVNYPQKASLALILHLDYLQLLAST